MLRKLRVLVVDDQEPKSTFVKRQLSRELGAGSVVFEVADTYESAMEALKKSYFDVVLLDIRIPTLGQEPSESSSRRLLQDLLDGKALRPAHVIGLTQHHDIDSGTEAFFRESLLAFERFDFNELGWAVRIAARLRYLMLSSSASLQFHLGAFDYDLAIICARHDNEYVPLKEEIFGKKNSREISALRVTHHGGTVKVGQRTLRSALICTEQSGLSASAAICTQALTILRPRVVAMLGMCAGFQEKGVGILDVLIATDATCWQEGRLSNKKQGSGWEFENRLKPIACSENFRKLANNMTEKYESSFGGSCGEWSREEEYIALKKRFGADVKETPKVYAGGIVSGSAVVDSTAMVEEVLRRNPAAFGLDMEVFGVYTAADKALGVPPHFVAVKAVADFADGFKKKQAQKYASALSWRVFRAMLSNVPAEVWLR